MADKGAEQGGCGYPDLRPYLLGSVTVGHVVEVGDFGDDPPKWKGVGRIPPQGVPQADREAP